MCEIIHYGGFESATPFPVLEKSVRKYAVVLPRNLLFEPL